MKITISQRAANFARLRMRANRASELRPIPLFGARAEAWSVGYRACIKDVEKLYKNALKKTANASDGWDALTDSLDKFIERK